MTDLYTPEQANKTLAEVRPIVNRIVALKKEIDSAVGYEQSGCAEELNAEILKLEEKGIEIKDMDVGLIDFPAKRFNEKVYLCWKLGEPEVMYWHDLHSGFRGRRLLKPGSLRAK